MHLPRAALGLAIAVSPLGVLSQVITITERPSACSAIYTTGSSSVTVVQSTVTVAPIPFSDALVNAGTPFVIEVQPGTAARRRQAESSTYIDVDGRTTTNASEAAVYRILNGTLQGILGGYVSCDPSKNSASFALSVLKKAISTTFFSRGLEIGWNNTAFTGGSCDFYTTAAGDGTLDVISYFRGIVDASWLAVTFAVKAASSVVPDPTTSTSVSTFYISTSDGVTITPAVTPVLSTSVSEVVIPTPTGDPTENGYCGAEAGICDGVVFGRCCSQYGACGNTDEYCGVGCQSAFGICNPVVASSSVVPPAPGMTSESQIAPIYSATAPQPATSFPAASSLAPIMSTTVYQSTSVFLSSSGSVTMTMTTMIPVTSSLPIFTAPGTPIGPINPPQYSSSVAAPSSAAVSSAVLPPSPSASSTPAGISTAMATGPGMGTGVPIPTSIAVSVPTSIAVSISVPGISSSRGAATSAPPYSSPNAVPSSSPNAVPSSSAFVGVSSVPVVLPSSSLVVPPLPSFYSSPPAPVSSIVSSAVIPPASSTRVASSSAIVAPPVASSCPGAADGSVTTDSRGDAYTLYCNSDYSGNLAQLPDTASFDACLLICDRTAGCGAVTYVPTNTYCYLKPAGGYVTGSGGYVGVRVAGAVIGASSMPPVVVSTSDGVAITSTPMPDTYPTTASVPALPTEESIPAPFSTTYTLASETPVLPSEAPIYSITPSELPFSSTAPIIDIFPTPTPIPEYPTTSLVDPVFSSTPLPEPVFSSTPVPDTYPTTTTDSGTPSSTFLVLPSPTRCDFGDPIGYGEDDSYCLITLPQPMVLYTKQSTNTYASTNGFLSILSGATQYQNAGTLPTDQVTEADNTTPLSALFPFWDDLAIPEGTEDYGIYYQLSDTGVTYEFYLSRPGQLTFFHFTVEYNYAEPGVATFTYYELDDPGENATVGSQGFDATGTAVGVVYSYQSGTITQGLVVRCDTLANTCVKTSA